MVLFLVLCNCLAHSRRNVLTLTHQPPTSVSLPQLQSFSVGSLTGLKNHDARAAAMDHGVVALFSFAGQGHALVLGERSRGVQEAANRGRQRRLSCRGLLRLLRLSCCRLSGRQPACSVDYSAASSTYLPSLQQTLRLVYGRVKEPPAGGSEGIERRWSVSQGGRGCRSDGVVAPGRVLLTRVLQ